MPLAQGSRTCVIAKGEELTKMSHVNNPPVMAAIAYPEVETSDDLPDALDHQGQIYLVCTSIGDFGDDRKRAGLWKSNGETWERLGQLVGSGGVIFSSPPIGNHRVHNIYGIKTGEKYHPTFEWEKEPVE